MGKQTKKYLLSFIVIFLISYWMISYQLPYYIHSPGTAEPLDEIVHVDEGFISEGDMHLVTISGIQATPLTYIIAKLRAFSDVIPLEQVRPEGMSDKEYRKYQARLMETSQH